MIQTICDRFSYYLKPISNVNPCRTVNLELICNLISNGKLKPVTDQVRSGKKLKTKVLPFITASGVFEKRSMDHLISYSGIVGIDLDDIDTSIKSELFTDPFLNPALIFISPSNNGIKMFIRVTDSISDRHDQYFNTISMYLYEAYGVISDPSCRDISRACFLCHDADAFYSDGSVSASSLIGLIPKLKSVIPVADIPNVVLRVGHRKYVPPHVHPLQVNNDHTSYICGKLNTGYAVYNYACSLLKLDGWTQRDIYWYRPGKQMKDGHSAIFTWYIPYGIFLFTNYSSSTVHFSVNKSYNLCSLISIIGYHSYFEKCILDLQKLFQYNL